MQKALIGMLVLGSLSAIAGTLKLDPVDETKIVTHYGAIDVSVLEYEDKEAGVKCYIAHTSGRMDSNTAAVGGALNPNLSCVKVR